MKKPITLIFILLLFISAKAQENETYPQLIDEKEDYYTNYSYEDYKSQYHQEYTFYYKRATTKDSKSQINNLQDRLLPWEIIDKYNPKYFFNQIINSIRVEDFGDDKLNISMVYDLSTEQLKEFKQTRGIVNKEKLLDLLHVNIISTDIINTTTNKQIELDKSWTSFCCNLLPNDTPTKERFIYYTYIKNKNTNFKNLSGTITVQLELPTAYIVKEITKNDIGKTIEIAENQKIKLIEFVDNKIHFEILNKEKLKSEIKFTNVSSNVKSIYMPKYLYHFFRLNPKIKHLEFEKEYQKLLDIKEENLEENIVYVYTLKGRPEKFYLLNKKTVLKKEIVLKIN
ncbi:hypothetical protein IUY40_04780 [Flavobacterium sp. ALJ2]|uniref:hypothetical protein n=1 Tax=Flavobacterium sp. ALJ2 TaxID=2786960 RepID=UPI00189F51BD|nr:hypothetical protein [Flavobacterium sp. ALJ2]MBF7090852.1 hypothetical protein [Flavobacterium sp. ALJ2]